MWSTRWSPRLRQGDVFGLVDFPLAKAGYGRLLPESSPAATPTVEDTQLLTIRGGKRYAVVVSHDCEFNEGKRAHFLAARLQEIPKDDRQNTDRLAELWRGNDYRACAAAGQPVALDAFIVPELPGLTSDPMLVNFVSTTAFPMKFRSEMLKLKRAEMEHSQRCLFREKLAAFFGRPADDVAEEYKIDIPDDPAELVWREAPVAESEASPTGDT